MTAIAIAVIVFVVLPPPVLVPLLVCGCIPVGPGISDGLAQGLRYLITVIINWMWKFIDLLELFASNNVTTIILVVFGHWYIRISDTISNIFLGYFLTPCQLSNICLSANHMRILETFLCLYEGFMFSLCAW